MAIMNPNGQFAPGTPYKVGDGRWRPGRLPGKKAIKTRIRREIVPELEKAIPGLVVGIRSGDPASFCVGLLLAAFALEDEPVRDQPQTES